MSAILGNIEEPATSNIANLGEYLAPKEAELTKDHVIDFLK